ncbi:MAG: 3-deoxy-manno-octulosonate cytidylyltransferase [Desulfobacteraceae bacterium]
MNIAVIPSRFGSKRFKGKPLAMISGKTLIQRAYEQAVKAENIKKVVVATDDTRIFEAVNAFGGKALMTSQDLRSGTDRVAQASTLLKAAPEDIIINIQGDQPVFAPQCLDQLIEPFKKDHTLNMATLAVKNDKTEQMSNPGNVKVVFDRNQSALYFSRSKIPFYRDISENEFWYKHLGFYAYRKKFLDHIAGLPDTRLENIEKLEQLRVLEHGYKIRVVITEYSSQSVDVREDIELIEKDLKQPME